MMKINMTKHTHPGMLITFCGLDGCGKTTLINHLVAYLQNQGINPVLTKQPTPFVRQSAIFRTYMDEPNHDAYSYRSLSLLAASDRIQHVHSVVEPALKAGKVVISDRYFYSCLANLRARGYVEDQWIYEIAESMLKPDLAFFIDAPVEVAVSRVRARENERNRYIDMDLQYNLRDEYRLIATAENAPILDSTKTIEETLEKLYLLTDMAMEKKGITYEQQVSKI
jgi:dTMP kinase